MIMRLTKKAAALLVAATMVVSMGVTPALADDPVPDTQHPTTASTTAETAGQETATATKTTVTYAVKSSYSWSVPAMIDFGDTAGVNKTRKVEATKSDNSDKVAATNDKAGSAQQVKVLGNTIPVGTSLHVTIAKASNYDTDKTSFYVESKNATNSKSEKLYYTIATTSNGTPLGQTGEVMSVPSGTNTKNQSLYFELNTDTTVEKAGTYNGDLVFMAQVTDDTVTGG